MNLNSDMMLFVDWESIQMDSAEVIPNIKLDAKLDDKVIADYFNFMFQEIVPWVNEYHPQSVTSFKMPSSIPGYIDIKDLTIEARDNYLAFGMNPQFLVYQDDHAGGPWVHSAHVSLFESLLKLTQ